MVALVRETEACEEALRMIKSSWGSAVASALSFLLLPHVLTWAS